MPELPEVETTLQGLKPFLLDAKIKAFHVRQPKLRWPVPVQAIKRSLTKCIINDLYRRGKYLIINTNQGSHIVHLGMSGSLRIVNKHNPPEPHDHIDLELSTGMMLRYRDPRRFGAWLFSKDPLKHKLLKNLGPEPLSCDFTGQYLYRKAQQSKRPIKTFIMDHHVVVGVGNIYASESLFLAGISPSRRSDHVSLKRCEHLVEHIKSVLRKAIKCGGTTLKDFKQASGKPGYFQQELNVYGKKDEPCPQCQNTIEAKIIGQRNSFFCKRCQK